MIPVPRQHLPVISQRQRPHTFTFSFYNRESIFIPYGTSTIPAVQSCGLPRIIALPHDGVSASEYIPVSE